MGMKRNSAHFQSQGQGGDVKKISGGAGGKSSGGRRPSFPKKDGQIKHMFRNAPGHLADTPANRNLMATVASNEHNCIGVDKHGNRWYARNVAGKQYWVKVRDGTVVDCGMNEKPRKLDQIFDRKDKK